MPCVQAAEGERGKNTVKQNRRDVNEFHGVTDPVEVLKIVHRSRKYDPLVNWIPHPTPADRLYSELSEDESESPLQSTRDPWSVVSGLRMEDDRAMFGCVYGCSIRRLFEGNDHG